MSADSDAFKTVQQLPGLSPLEQHYLMPVARGEGFYGLGWGNPSQFTIEQSAKFGVDPRAGVGSNNWGAEQGQGANGSFPHVDTHRDGTPYVANYKRNLTPADGAASIARTLLKPNVREALKTGVYKGIIHPEAGRQQFNHPELEGKQLGRLKAAVYTQHNNRYFELSPENYLDAVTRNYAAIVKNLGLEPLLLSPVPSEIVEAIPLSDGSLGSGLPDISSGEPSSLLTEVPEAGFLRNQEFSVPGIQDGEKKK